MKNKILIQGIILTIFIVAIGTLPILKFFSSNAYPANVQAYAYNKPSYYGQYNYRYNNAYNQNNGFVQYPYTPMNNYRGSGAANYVGGYGQHGWSPFLMPSTTYNPYQGYQTNYNSHINVRNKLDYVYYTNPDLLQPRRMNSNNLRYTWGTWPMRYGPYGYA